MEETQDEATPQVNGKRRYIALGAVLILALGAFIFWLVGRGWVSTDDAQVQGDLVQISPKVTGYVNRVLVRDNQEVRAGDLLVELDRKDLSTKLASSKAGLAAQTSQASAASTQVSLVTQTATAGEQQAGANAAAAMDGITSARSDLQAAKAQIDAAQAAVEVAQADVVSAEAQAKKVATDAERYRKLYAEDATSKQQLDTAEAANVSAQSALKAARERVKSANAALEQARARKTAAEAGLKQAVSRASAAQAGHSASSTSPQQIEISQAQKKIAAARLKQSIADILNAQLQLSYTRIMAPVSGIVSQKSIETGEFVQPGQPLMALVDLDSVWVVANFKETQIGRMKVGQPVVITVDSYPGRKLTGHVDSIGAATGAKFSLLPAENATGNFVKVVQRIPVKIVMDRPFPGGIVLRPGMNVTAKVHLVGGRG